MSYVPMNNLDKLLFQSILDNRAVVFHFQPIISSRQKRVIGYEGLVRGIDPLRGSLISPLALYKTAKDCDRLLELDRVCRTECLRSFRNSIYNRDQQKIVFMNFEISLLEEGSAGASFMVDLAKEMQVSPYNVVVEIIESKVRDTKALQRFIEVLKYYGFLIALDDVGVGHSNFDRIPIVKPNIIKIDRSIIKGIEGDYYKQEVFKALVNLCRKIGSLVLAEGVETLEEVTCCLTLGADLLQGYFFSKPMEGMFLESEDDLSQVINHVIDIYKKGAIRRLKEDKDHHRAYDRFMKELSSRLKDVQQDLFEGLLQENIGKTTFVDALFVLSKEGIQITETVVLYDVNRPKNILYLPAKKGDDMSSKDYYYLLVHTGLNRYVTDSYISHATGNKCRTISLLFRNKENKEFILCVDINENTDYYYRT